MSKVKMVRGEDVKFVEHDWQIKACEAIGFKKEVKKPKKTTKKKDK